MRRQGLFLASIVALSVALLLVSSACSSDEGEAVPEATPTVQPTVQPVAEPTVALEDHSETTGSKVLFLTASTSETLSRGGGNYGIELRGTDLEHPLEDAGLGNLAALRCDVPPCEWTIVPETASTYEFRAVLLDLTNGMSAAESPPIRAVWTAPPRPHAFKFLVNGKSLPTSPLNAGDSYIPVRARKIEVETQWTTDAGGTGYYVVVSTVAPKEKEYARCSTGTSCLVPTMVPLKVGQEMSWNVKVLTTRGDKVASAFQVCAIGKA